MSETTADYDEVRRIEAEIAKIIRRMDACMAADDHAEWQASHKEFVQLKRDLEHMRGY